jgi:hypothetical protein
MGEELYYSERYVAEIEDGQLIQFIQPCLTAHGQQIVDRYIHIFEVGLPMSYSDLDQTAIGNVSRQSRRHHERHVKLMSESPPILMSVKLIDAAEEVLVYFRVHHPLHYVRSMCNVMLGLRRFCLPQLLSGHDSVVSHVSSLRSIASPRSSLHQREVASAIKLLTLASGRDDYTVGLRHCHRLLAKGGPGSKTVLRTLKAYRQLGFLFSDIQSMLRDGSITVKMLNAVSSELEDREVRKYKYMKTPSVPFNFFEQVTDPSVLIDSAMDELFTSLEAFAEDLIVSVETGTPDTTVEDVMHELSGEFDIGIEDQIEGMIRKLGLRPSGPHGFIDLGEEPDPGEDWWDA